MTKAEYLGSNSFFGSFKEHLLGTLFIKIGEKNENKEKRPVMATFQNSFNRPLYLIDVKPLIRVTTFVIKNVAHVQRDQILE